MKSFLSFLLILCSLAATAQEPYMLSMIGIGGNGSENISNYVTKTADGGFITHIETSSAINSGNIDTFCSVMNKRQIFVKYNADASLIEWSKCYGYNGDSFLLHFFPTNDGGVVLGGMFNSSIGWGWLIMKQDASGNVLWQHNYSKGSGAPLRAMQATADGGYIMMGESIQTDSNVLTHYGGGMEADLWVLKVDSNGNKVWSRIIGGTGHESGAALVPAPGGGCYVVGGTGSYDYDCTGNPGGGTAYIARLDQYGTLMWHKCLGGSKMDVATAACDNGKGGLIIAAQTYSSDYDVHYHNGNSDYWAVEVDSAGAVVWDRCYGTNSYEIPQAICRATDGSIWINGFTNDNFDDVLLVRVDSVGNLLGSKIMGSYNKDRGQIVHSLGNGLVLVGGSYYANSGDFSSLTNYGPTDIFLSVFAPWAAGVDEDKFPPNSFKIYPNPTNNVLYVDRQGSRGEYVVSIINMMGWQVHSVKLKENESSITIDVSNLQRGVYYLQVTGTNGSRATQKLIVQ
jgi:hypothetical protein